MLPVNLSESRQECFCQSLFLATMSGRCSRLGSVPPPLPHSLSSSPVRLKETPSLHWWYRIMPQWVSLRRWNCEWQQCCDGHGLNVFMWLWQLMSDLSDGLLCSGSVITWFRTYLIFFCGWRAIRWKVLVNGVLPWHLSNYWGIRKLPGVYELISLPGFSVPAQIPGEAFLMGWGPTETWPLTQLQSTLGGTISLQSACMLFYLSLSIDE